MSESVHMPGDVDREVGRLAVARGWLTDRDVEACLHAAKTATPPMNFMQVLLSKGLATETQVRDLVQSVGGGQEMPSAPRAGLGAGMKFGGFAILAELGRGGMGAVYKAHDPVLGRVVALKILSDRHIATDEDVRRFQRESKLAARLRHPHLVQVHEAGIHDGVPYFTMEYVEGKTLDDLLLHELTSVFRNGEKPRLGREDKIRIMIRVAEAVHVAHRAGIIHRDLKPANIIIDASNEPHVTDFGLAKEVESMTFLTSTGTAMGTPYYMPPEQARGEVRGLDSRTDVYAMGAVLYHALTLKLPFMDETGAMVLRKVIEEDPEPPRRIDPTIDRALERIICTAMAKDRADRYPTAADFARDLERCLTGQRVQARGPSPARQAERWVRRHPSWAASAAVSVILLMVFSIVLFFRPGRLTLRTDPPGAEVWVDGKKLEAPTPIENLALPRGRHEVRLVRTGYRTQVISMDITGGGEQVRQERLEAQTGRLSLASNPATVEVRLSGPQKLVLQTPIDLLALPDGDYRAEFFRPQYQLGKGRVKIQDRTDARHSVELREAVRWRVTSGDGIHPELAAEDLDGDRMPDIVGGSKDGRIFAISGKDGRSMWSLETRHPAQTRPVIADVDGDGRPEVLVGVGTSGFLCLRGKDGASRYFARTGHRAYVAIVPRDGIPDVCSAGWDGTLTCYRGKSLLALRPETAWTVPLGARPLGGPMSMGRNLVVVTQAPRVLVVDPEGALLRAWDLKGPARVWTLDERAEEVIVGGKDDVAAWSLKTGKPRWSRPIGAAPTAIGLGPLLLISTEEGFLVALDPADGSERWRHRTDQGIPGRAQWADLDGDGRLEVLVGSQDRRVSALDAGGAPRWHYLAGGGVSGSPVAVDLSGDGIPEIIFGADDGAVTAVSMFSR
jgi:outer membrane protein assembly factor BamB